MEARQILTEGPLFELVQMLRLFGDSKAFPDGSLKAEYTPDQIQREFAAFLAQFYGDHDEASSLKQLKQPQQPDLGRRATHDAIQTRRLALELQAWILQRFDLPAHKPRTIPPSATMEEHLERMWYYLSRNPAHYATTGTLIPLPHPFVVPGGRYIEQYYWDTYFTCLGLAASGRIAAVQGMADNFAALIETVGYIPNANRSYYYGRSQPPFFAPMIKLLARGGVEVSGYFPALVREYDYWMDTSRGERKTVRLGTVTLNRYWDEHASPRPEGHYEDVSTALEAGIDPQSPAAQRLYRDLRAGAESGWDYSSRWIEPTGDGAYPLHRIRTTAILPVDLNALLFIMEQTLAQLATQLDKREAAMQYSAAADQRGEAIRSQFWDSECRWFVDRLLPDNSSTGILSLAGMMPLYAGVLDPQRDRAILNQVVATLEANFLQTGGVVSTLIHSGQQWDWPNGWAPLQWITVVGLLNYGYDDLAREIARRWVDLARRTFHETGKIMEKYNVCERGVAGGGGEYPNQEGFGWTNGVVVGFLALLRGERFW